MPYRAGMLAQPASEFALCSGAHRTQPVLLLLFGYEDLASTIIILCIHTFQKKCCADIVHGFATYTMHASKVSEIARLRYPAVQKAFMASPMGKIMREREVNQMTGTPYFVLGCTIVITLFDKQVAIASILYLIFGDMTAALVGVSFGGDAVVVKLGREGKKSVEGSVGMFVVCFVLGLTLFNSVYVLTSSVSFWFWFWFGLGVETLCDTHIDRQCSSIASPSHAGGKSGWMNSVHQYALPRGYTFYPNFMLM